jgi:hypothetical protein
MEHYCAILPALLDWRRVQPVGAVVRQRVRLVGAVRVVHE